MMLAVAVLIHRGGCGSLLFLVGGFMISGVRTPTLAKVTWLVILLVVLTIMAGTAKNLRNVRRDWAFTLLGLLWSVLLIPFVLNAYGVPLHYTDSPIACKSNLKNIATALEMYSTDHEGEFPDSLEELTPNYLRKLPRCQRQGQDMPEFFKPYFEAQGIRFEEYGYLKQPHYNYELRCRSGHPRHLRDYPRYTSVEGLLEGHR